jgi:hypothetical protein
MQEKEKRQKIFVVQSIYNLRPYGKAQNATLCSIT